MDSWLYADIEGSTDSEALFFLALTFGLVDDPFAAVVSSGRVRGEGRPRATGWRRSGADDGGDDGRGVAFWVFRYSSEGKSRSLFFSTKVGESAGNCILRLRSFIGLSDEARFVVSEPLRDLRGAWNEVPESSAGVVRPGQDEFVPFTPEAPART